MKNFFESKFYQLLKSELSFLLIGLLMFYIRILMAFVSESLFPFDPDFSTYPLNIVIVGTFLTTIICGCLWWFVLRHLLKNEILCNAKFPLLTYVLNCIYILILLFYNRYDGYISHFELVIKLIAIIFWLLLFIYNIKYVMPPKENKIKRKCISEDSRLSLIKTSIRSCKVVNSYIILNSFLLLVIFELFSFQIDFSILDIFNADLFFSVVVGSYIDRTIIILILFLINFIFNGYLYEKILNFKYFGIIQSINLLFVAYFFLFFMNNINCNILIFYEGSTPIWCDLSMVLDYFKIFVLFYLWSWSLFKIILNKMKI